MTVVVASLGGEITIEAQPVSPGWVAMVVFVEHPDDHPDQPMCAVYDVIPAAAAGVWADDWIARIALDTATERGAAPGT